MGASWDIMRSLASRDDPGQELLQLLNDPFKQELGDGAIWSALGSSIGITLGIAILFSFVRPYNTVVYAPKLKHSDEKHAPPPIGKGVFAWMKPLWSTSERDVIGHAGLDAAVFLRFTRMCRNIFLVLSLFGCAILIPVNWTQNSGDANQKWLKRITPLTVWNSAQWSSVIFGYLVNITICGFLWWNYRKILELRRVYFESEEYQYSLHARTLMINDLPKNMASDEGIARLIDEVIPQSSFARTAVARNVKVLPDIIAQHDRTVRKLESVLAKYLKDPKNLPAARPTCKPSKKDPSYGTYPRGQKVDAIEYLTQRIKDLEIEIKEVRTTLDKRNTLLYGFASYDDIGEAHCIAHALRKKKPKGATVRLAPRPNDIIWDNMPMSPSARSWNRFWNNIWVAVLTMVWIVPNAMIAIFLVNLNNLGLVWTDFQNTLAADTTFWSIVQGILSPAITSLVYLVLPIIFRRLSIKAGDRTKTGRERHVLSKLYSFFVFNNLVIFSIFSTLWTFITAVIADTEKTGDAWQSLGKQDPAGLLFIALCNISPFWVTYLLQRQLGVATDLAQVWKLTWSFFQRKLGSPTPRELIELTAPPPFEYAMYYNYFLYYTTIALCYGGLQPLVLPAAALYFAVDVCLRKYLLLYIFVTKTESGGMFWRVLFNRIIFATMLANCLIFLAVWVRGEGTHIQAFAVVPLPFFMLAFKFYCARAFDTKIHYYATRNVIRNPEVGNGKDPLRSDRLASRFGHPALYKPLITPMVHSKAQNVLPSVYRGRISDGREAFSGDTMSTSGYSDAYIMNPMDKSGKAKSAVPGFELVPEGKLDFEYYKNRPEFASEHGGGEIYGRAADMMRPGTPGSMWNGSEPSSRPASPSLPTIPRTASPGPGRSHTPYSPIVGNSSPYAPTPEIGRSRSPFYALGNESGSNLVSNAAAMPMTNPGSREPSMDHSGTRAPGGAGMLGGGPRGYGNLPQDEDMTPDHDPMAYDYFRSSRTRRS
ncbi:putative CSC1/OSCA1-like 7TM region domain-containing protein [Seiridium cardinale]|uniref:CSC1/OSCA1-like 7TM region domain-containing protein n=1 Tax=Seiridium cardinale TaxID=138064 RepID=A0ABR2XTK6_9PEZI